METKEKTVAKWFREVEGHDIPIDGIDWKETLRVVSRDDASFHSRMHAAFQLGYDIVRWLFSQLGALRVNNTVLSIGMSRRLDDVLSVAWQIFSWSPQLFELELSVRVAQVEALMFHVQRDKDSAPGTLEDWCGGIVFGFANSSLQSWLKMGKTKQDADRNETLRTRVILPLLRAVDRYLPGHGLTFGGQWLLEFASSGYGGDAWKKKNSRLRFIDAE